MEAQVFDRFVRGHGPADRASRNGTGTGLGLSIVRAVAVAHGGSVTAGSSEAGGAAFDVRLPLEARSRSLSEQLTQLEDSFRPSAEYLPRTRQQPLRSSPIFDRDGT